jgi:peptide/nickel transport system ATP-binding protein
MPDPPGARRRYPHELSGGQLQRIAIAMALASEPRLIIFDEPTTGLDVTTAAEVIGMLNGLIRERRLAAVYISHDLALLAAIADELVVFYAGEVVESGPTQDVITRPRHPYTRALLDALPSARRALRPQGIPGLPPGRVVVDRCGFAARCPYAEPPCHEGHPELAPVEPERLVRCVRAGALGPLPSAAASFLQPAEERRGGRALEVSDLVCEYGHGAGRVVAVDGVSLEVREREVVALVGESGSGKSTIGRAITGLLVPRAGTLRWRGEALTMSGRRTHAQHREIQIIFQNPDSSLNPRHTVGQLIGRAVALFRGDVPPKARGGLVADALREVQLDPALMSRYPHQLSGGQKQRVAMARAFVARPRLVICDEIISGQDVSVQATILELVRTMQREHATALLFISHDLAAVRSIAQYVYVLQGGRIQEHAATERLFAAPAAAYTRRLLAAVLEPDVPREGGDARAAGGRR